jgi:hypothetical protein
MHPVVFSHPHRDFVSPRPQHLLWRRSRTWPVVFGVRVLAAQPRDEPAGATRAIAGQRGA